jgi:hypothetical protein
MANGFSKMRHHSSLIESAVFIVRILERLSAVRKFMPGKIANRPSKAKGTISVKLQNKGTHGLIVVRHGSALQEVRFYCDGSEDIEQVFQEIEQKLAKKKSSWMIRRG